MILGQVNEKSGPDAVPYARARDLILMVIRAERGPHQIPECFSNALYTDQVCRRIYACTFQLALSILAVALAH